MVLRVGDAGAAPHGASSPQMRNYNQRLLLQSLRRLGEASKADLARAACLTNTAVGDIIKDLTDRGLIRILGKKHDGARGQPATMLSLDPEGAYAIGVRLDRARIETALTDLNGRIVDSRMHDTRLPTPRQALAMVSADVHALIGKLPPERHGRLTGIGLARPWNVGSWHRELDLPADAFAEWSDADFAEELERDCGLPVAEENDGTAAAVAELFHGIGRTLDDFLYVFVGPAIGGGVVLGGSYLRGGTSNAGDIGVMPVGPSALASAPQANGRQDILLARASLNALQRHLRFAGVESRGLSDLPAAIARAPRAMDEWLDDAAQALALPLLSAAALLDVRTVVIDSDLETPWVDALIARTTAIVAAARVEARDPPALRRGSFGAAAGAVGAAALPLFVHFGPGAHGMGTQTPRGGVFALVA